MSDQKLPTSPNRLINEQDTKQQKTCTGDAENQRLRGRRKATQVAARKKKDKTLMSNAPKISKIGTVINVAFFSYLSQNATSDDNELTALMKKQRLCKCTTVQIAFHGFNAWDLRMKVNQKLLMKFSLQTRMSGNIENSSRCRHQTTRSSQGTQK